MVNLVTAFFQMEFGNNIRFKKITFKFHLTGYINTHQLLAFTTIHLSTRYAIKSKYVEIYVDYSCCCTVHIVELFNSIPTDANT